MPNIRQLAEPVASIPVPVPGMSVTICHMFTDPREEADCREFQFRADSLAVELQRTREKCLPN